MKGRIRRLLGVLGLSALLSAPAVPAAPPTHQHDRPAPAPPAIEAPGQGSVFAEPVPPGPGALANPHFWGLAQAHRDDYRQAGLPGLFTRLDDADLRRLGLLRITALLSATAQLLIFQVVIHPAARLLLVAVVAAGILRVGRCLQRRESPPFAHLNAFMALLLLALLLDSALPPL